MSNAMSAARSVISSLRQRAYLEALPVSGRIHAGMESKGEDGAARVTNLPTTQSSMCEYSKECENKQWDRVAEASFFSYCRYPRGFALPRLALIEHMFDYTL